MDYRKYGPKRADHPSIGYICSACGVPFKEGDYTTLEEVEPADDEEKLKASMGRPYTALAEEIHWACRVDRSD